MTITPTLCRIVPPGTDGVAPCGKPATHVIRFQDGDRAPACAGCVLAMGQIAGSHGVMLDVRKMEEG